MEIETTLNLEVACDASALGDQIGISGEDPSLGGWALEAAPRLTLSASSEGASPTWRGHIPIPLGGSQFKLVLFKGSEVVWEPLAENRRFPLSGIGSGCTLRMKYGEARIGVEASASQLAENARKHRTLEERRGSALQEDVDCKGENAYYYAHNRKFEVPEHAKVITGPGIITGGQPVLMEVGTTTVDATADERTVWMKDYSWSDGKGKVKVYVPVPEGLLPQENAESIVEAAFTSHQVDLTINSKPRQKLKIEKLNAEIKVDECSARVEAHKNRVVLQLAKKRDTTWYNLCKGK